MDEIKFEIKKHEKALSFESTLLMPSYAWAYDRVTIAKNKLEILGDQQLWLDEIEEKQEVGTFSAEFSPKWSNANCLGTLPQAQVELRKLETSYAKSKQHSLPEPLLECGRWTLQQTSGIEGSSMARLRPVPRAF